MHSCHPHRPHHPPRPAPPQGYLVQKIIACERRSIPCLCTEWCFDGCVQHTIQQAAVSGMPDWEIKNGCTLRLTVPVTVRLCDPCGRCITQPASVAVETDLPRSFLCGLDDPRNTLLVLPCIRLSHAECTCGGCFRVQLSVSLELYLLRYEAIHGCPPKPSCPQLPLYPPPMC